MAFTHSAVHSFRRVEESTIRHHKLRLKDVGIGILEFTISSQGRGCHKKPYVIPIGSMFGTQIPTLSYKST